LYAAVQSAVDDIGDLRLVDFTSTENVCLKHLPGKLLESCKFTRNPLNVKREFIPANNKLEAVQRWSAICRV